MGSEELDDVFFALSNATRREILARLSRGSGTVQEVAEPFDVSLNTVSKHIRVLERAALVRREVRGREHHLSLRAEPLRRAAGYVRRYERFWNTRLDALESYLSEGEEST